MTRDSTEPGAQRAIGTTQATQSNDDLGAAISRVVQSIQGGLDEALALPSNQFGGPHFPAAIEALATLAASRVSELTPCGHDLAGSKAERAEATTLELSPAERAAAYRSAGPSMDDLISLAAAVEKLMPMYRLAKHEATKWLLDELDRYPHALTMYQAYGGGKVYPIIGERIPMDPDARVRGSSVTHYLSERDHLLHALKIATICGHMIGDGDNPATRDARSVGLVFADFRERYIVPSPAFQELAAEVKRSRLAAASPQPEPPPAPAAPALTLAQALTPVEDPAAEKAHGDSFKHSKAPGERWTMAPSTDAGDAVPLEVPRLVAKAAPVPECADGSAQAVVDHRIVPPVGGSWPHRDKAEWTEAERAAMREMRRNGMNDIELGCVVGCSRQRVGQLIGSKQGAKALVVEQARLANLGRRHP